jgi:hypothetical protein
MMIGVNYIDSLVDICEMLPPNFHAIQIEVIFGDHETQLDWDNEQVGRMLGLKN